LYSLIDFGYYWHIITEYSLVETPLLSSSLSSFAMESNPVVFFDIALGGKLPLLLP
jgi:hypothetical protein